MNRSVLPSALLTLLAGLFLAVQTRANGSLAGVLGHGLFAAAVSFGLGFVALLIGLVFNPRARAALRDLIGHLRSGVTPWWGVLGGLGGASVVVAQGLTVTYIGVAVFTMCFICGQLIGAIVVDMTWVSPHGPIRPRRRRILGTAIVLVGVLVSTLAGGVAEIPVWAPIFPILAGGLSAVQQAVNGRVRARVHSAYAATFVNFLVGFSALLVVAVVTAIILGPPQAVPGPAQLWMLTGGLLGVGVIFVNAVTVGRLGVLLLSLLSLVGNLGGSVLLDLAIPGQAPVTWWTGLSLALVLIGVLVTMSRGEWLRLRRRRSVR